MLFLIIFWSLMYVEIDSKRMCSKMLLAPEVSLTSLWFPRISFLPFLKVSLIRIFFQSSVASLHHHRCQESHRDISQVFQLS